MNAPFSSAGQHKNDLTIWYWSDLIFSSHHLAEESWGGHWGAASLCPGYLNDGHAVSGFDYVNHKRD